MHINDTIDNDIDKDEFDMLKEVEESMNLEDTGR